MPSEQAPKYLRRIAYEGRSAQKSMRALIGVGLVAVLGAGTGLAQHNNQLNSRRDRFLESSPQAALLKSDKLAVAESKLSGLSEAVHGGKPKELSTEDIKVLKGVFEGQPEWQEALTLLNAANTVRDQAEVYASDLPFFLNETLLTILLMSGGAFLVGAEMSRTTKNDKKKKIINSSHPELWKETKGNLFTRRDLALASTVTIPKGEIRGNN